MSQVNNFLVVAGCPDTDDVPASDDLRPPWIQLDQHVVGDGKVMEARVWARVTNGLPDANGIAAELRAVPWSDPDDVMLLVKEQEDYAWRVVDWRVRERSEEELLGDIVRGLNPFGAGRDD